MGISDWLPVSVCVSSFSDGPSHTCVKRHLVSQVSHSDRHGHPQSHFLTHCPCLVVAESDSFPFVKVSGVPTSCL